MSLTANHSTVRNLRRDDKLNFPDTWRPYRKIERERIQYTYCMKFDHISRYMQLRQVIHNGNQPSRYISLETTNPFSTDASMKIYVVPAHLENRLDVIAQNQLGSAKYAWIIAYINRIADGFTVLEGTRLHIPVSVSQLFEDGEIMGSIEATKLNLGSE